MNILVVAATENEIRETMDRTFSGNNVQFLITGVGMVATTCSLTEKLSKEHFDLIINAGLAGSFSPVIAIGETVIVKHDVFSELGAQDHNDFIPIERLGLNSDSVIYPLAFNKLIPGTLKKVKAITVNTIHGNEDSISTIKKRLQPNIESMEGAAVFYVCNRYTIPCIQIRTISNYVERRNKDKWNIPMAIKNLNSNLTDVLNGL